MKATLLFSLYFSIMTFIVCSHGCILHLRDKMNITRCERRNLTEVPLTLHKYINIFRLGYNQLTHLKKSDFINYPNLTEIYLYVNNISHIEFNTFRDLSNLRVLDLSQNNIIKFNHALPDLRKLDISYNPLEYLDLHDANVQKIFVVSCKLTRFPKLNPSKYVIYLNLYHNNITRIYSTDVAKLCRLKRIDLRYNPIKFDEHSCECQSFLSLLDKKIEQREHGILCPEKAECTNLPLPEIVLRNLVNCESLSNPRLKYDPAILYD